MNTKKTKSETRPVMLTPVKVCITKHLHGSKVLPCETVDESDIERLAKVEQGSTAKLLDAVAAHIRLNHDVVLCRGLRLFGCLDKDMKLFICAQTINEYRTSIEDVHYVTVKHERGTNAEREISRGEAEKALEAIREARRKTIEVKPDMKVICPKCGTEFRVGMRMREG